MTIEAFHLSFCFQEGLKVIVKINSKASYGSIWKNLDVYLKKMFHFRVLAQLQ